MERLSFYLLYLDKQKFPGVTRIPGPSIKEKKQQILKRQVFTTSSFTHLLSLWKIKLTPSVLTNREVEMPKNAWEKSK